MRLNTARAVKRFTAEWTRSSYPGAKTAEELSLEPAFNLDWFYTTGYQYLQGSASENGQFTATSTSSNVT
jgi:hypothetical protein